jgi:hypothetical protein
MTGRVGRCQYKLYIWRCCVMEMYWKNLVWWLRVSDMISFNLYLSLCLYYSLVENTLYKNFSPLSSMLDAPPSSSFLICSSQYLTRSTNYEAPHYVIFLILFHLLPSGPNIVNTLFSGTLPINYSKTCTEFCTSTNKQHAQF